jgi:Glycosyl transferases group 1
MDEARSAVLRESLRLEIERRARAEFYRDQAVRRGAELSEVERELGREASAARRLAVATLGRPAVRRLAVAIRAVLRFRPGQRAAVPALARSVNPAEREELERRVRERRLAEQSLRRARNRLGDIEWRLRVYRLHPRRQARRPLARLGSLLADSGATVAMAVHLAVALAIARLLAWRARRGPSGLDPPAGGWPRVTALVHGRPLEAIADAWRLLRETDYPALVPVIVGRHDAARRFDPRVADAIRSADGELVLVCTDASFGDPGWLAEMVLALVAEDRIGAVGPTVSGRSGGSGISFDLEGGAPLPRRSVRPVALTGECILFQAAALQPQAICDEYAGDLWAVDACIAMRTAGWSIRQTDVRLFQEPIAKLDPVDIDLLRSRWGPLLRRRVLVDLVNGGGEWCPRGICATSETGGDEVLDRVSKSLGWQLTGETKGDLELSLEHVSEGPAIKARWILPSGEPGAPQQPQISIPIGDQGFDGAAERLHEAVAASLDRTSFVIRLAAREWSAASNWGDYFLAAALRDCLMRRGHQVLLQVAEDQGSAPGSCLEVLLHLRGRRPAQTSPGQLNLVWQISHPAETPIEELEDYDAVLVASRSHARTLAETLAVPVHSFLQFTDPDRFSPRSDLDHAHELLFVGNWRYVFRRIVWDALPIGRELALIGQGWAYLAPEHLVAEYVPNAELAGYYASCSILLCDHWDDMREHGFISNRVFDALACGAFIISDHFEALVEEFIGAVETYREPSELHEKIALYLSRPEDRHERAVRGRDLVLRSHTSDHRANELLLLLPALAAQLRRPPIAALHASPADTQGPRSGPSDPAAT